MKILSDPVEWRQTHMPPGQCALVPTMGSLHEGHLSLVRQARATGLPVVVSIFVNRLQFLPHEDFNAYPRALEADAELLRKEGVSYLFAPNEDALYPQPQTYRVLPDPAMADTLEGQFRPGFFGGVCTVVLKLFNIIQPAVAVFGQKDYQQLAVIRQMVQQFDLPIDLLCGPTCRDTDGLALSSRNVYLSSAERSRAVQLIQTLKQLGIQARQAAQSAQTEDQWLSTLHDLETEAAAHLSSQGWAPDYMTVRQRENLQKPSFLERQDPWVMLGAAKLGKTRLIDNIEM